MDNNIQNYKAWITIFGV